MYKGKKSVILDASPSSAPALSFAGFDVVTVANNHFNDFGSEGANLSVEVLKTTGIRYFGISFGEYDSSQEPLILERNGIKIGFLGYCDMISINKNCTEMRMLFNSGPAIYRDDIATRDVNKLKKANVDIIVVYIHYGEELYLRPLPYQLHINKHLMSLGVQIIIGAHPHVLQPHYIKENKLVAYSLGNFIFHPKETFGGSNPKVYGRLDKKPNQYMIESFEHYVLGNCENLRSTEMLKVTVSRNGVVEAKYLPLKIAFDHKNKRIHPEPKKKAKWITVCGDQDERCKEFH
ncbi:capsule biosynthesis protein CapA-like [Oculina patagonica]